MKLLFAIKTLVPVGGAERVFCTVCSELAQRGHDLTVVTFDHPGSQPFYPLDSGIRRVHLSIGNVAQGARPGETLLRMIALRRATQAAKPHVAVGFMHSMFVPLAFALAGSDIPIVGSEHIVPEHYRSRPLQYALLLAASPFLSTVTVLSEAILARYPFPLRRRMIAMPNPISPADGKASPGDVKPRHVMLNVARLDAQKDHATLLRAFAQLAAAHPNWELRIFGEGPLRKQLQQLARELGLSGRVELRGTTPEIGAEYRDADIFVLPSRYESFGLATAEAMSYGLPVAAFADCPGTNEVIENNHTGLLAPAGLDRSTALARALEQLMVDAGLRRRLGDNAGLVISRLSSVKNVCDRWEHMLYVVATRKVRAWRRPS
jgi:glycosyltransferase involved in cell wall biosynthesis